MKGLLIGLFCLFAAVHKFPQQKKSDLHSIISTEYAFVAAAAELGTRDAFLKFVADDGIIFRPNPVNGKTFLSSAPKRPGLLSWYPVHAEVSAAGDMGFTTGPAEFRKDKDSSAIWFGNFCTVWQKQTDGQWKFAIDIGNQNAKPSTVSKPLQYQQVISEDKLMSKMMKAGNSADLIELDKQMNLFSDKSGMGENYKKFMNEESRILRDNIFPVVGIKEINDYSAVHSSRITFKPIDGKLSSSGDLGFTYGTADMNGDEKPAERFNYLHIYKKDKSRWIIAVEVLSSLD